MKMNKIKEIGMIIQHLPDWKRSRGLHLNDLNGAKGVIRLFNCFLQKTFALLFQWDLVQSNYNKKQHPIRYEGGRYRMLRQSVVPTGLIHASNNCIQNLYSEGNK